jgi:hypothetical protein
MRGPARRGELILYIYIIERELIEVSLTLSELCARSADAKSVTGGVWGAEMHAACRGPILIKLKLYIYLQRAVTSKQYYICRCRDRCNDETAKKAQGEQGRQVGTR